MNDRNEGILWSRDFILMMVANLLVSIAGSMLMTTLPLYALHIGGSNSVAGILMTVLALSALCTRPIYGNIMDKKGRKMVLVFGTATMLFSSLFYNLTTTIFMLLIIRFFNGVGFSAHTTASGTIVADLVPPSRLSEGIGYYGISNTLASAIGPAIGLFMIDKSGYQMLFWSILISWSLSLVFSLSINYEKKNKREMNLNDTSFAIPVELKSDKKVKNGLIEKSTVPIAVVSLVYAISISSVLTFIPIYGKVRGIDGIGAFYTVYALAILVARIVTGKLADKYGFTKLFVPGVIGLCLALVMIAFSHTLSLILVAGVIYGLASGTVFPLMNAIVIKLCPKGKRGLANATYYSSLDIGVAIGATVFGFISEISGYTAVYILSAVFGCVSLFLYMVLVHKRVNIIKRGQYLDIETN